MDGHESVLMRFCSFVRDYPTGREREQRAMWKGRESARTRHSTERPKTAARYRYLEALVSCCVLYIVRTHHRVFQSPKNAPQQDTSDRVFQSRKNASKRQKVRTAPNQKTYLWLSRWIFLRLSNMTRLGSYFSQIIN